jgi:hypothetical protein
MTSDDRAKSNPEVEQSAGNVRRLAQRAAAPRAATEHDAAASMRRAPRQQASAEDDEGPGPAAA